VTRTLVLWDIDHTLLHVGALTREVYAEAFLSVTGQPMEHLADLAGKTDLAIITATLELNRVRATGGLVSAFADSLATGFRARQGAIPAHGQLLPGARDALRALAGRADVVQSVLTGNSRPVAEVKLAAFAVDQYVDFGAGAYGMDGTARSALVEIARGRAAEKYGKPFPPAATVLIGDTPHDVTAGTEAGTRVVAVATGSSDERALRAAGAKTVLAGLDDTAEVLRQVLQDA